MNILVIPCWYPNGFDKLMGIYHKEYCEALSNIKDIKVNMLYIDRQRLNKPFKYLFMSKKEIIKENNYKVYLRKMLDIGKINFDFQMQKYYKVLEKAFLDYLKENPKPDIIHAQITIPSGYAACLLGKKYHIPVIITEHASYYQSFFTDKKYAKYGNFVLKNAYFTTVSNYMAKEIKKYNVEVETLPNLVNTKIFNLKHNIPNSLNIVVVSALRQGKRIDDIIEALKLIKEQEPNIKAKLTIVGDGFLLDYYQKKCQELKMTDYVSFVGRKTKPEIANIFQNQTLLVIASSIETFAIPGIEALASGLPVVSTKCLGPEEYLDDKCGKLVEVGDIKELAKSILEVYHNIHTYDINYLKSIANKYSSESVTNKALKIYQKLINKKGE